MDSPPEEMHRLGFVGIFKDSFKIIWNHKRTLGLIALVFILPLAFISLAQILVSDYLYVKIFRVESKIEDKPHDRGHLSNILTANRIIFCSVQVAYYLILMVFSLLSVSAVVYMVACAYAMKPVTFKKVMAVVPKVWKRLAVTLCWIPLASLVYGFSSTGLWVVVWGIFSSTSYGFEITVYVVLLILEMIGFAFLFIVWNLGSVISVLEDVQGIDAMVKAKDFCKGKIRVVSFVFLLFAVIFYGILLIYWYLVEFEWYSAFRAGLGILCLSLLTVLFLLGLVVQTVIYFVCKSYHYEHIGKPALSEHLEAFLPNYERLEDNKDVQLRQVNI